MNLETKIILIILATLTDTIPVFCTVAIVGENAPGTLTLVYLGGEQGGKTKYNNCHAADFLFQERQQACQHCSAPERLWDNCIRLPLAAPPNLTLHTNA